LPARPSCSRSSIFKRLANRLTNFSPHRPEVFPIPKAVTERLASFLTRLAACFSYRLAPFKGGVTKCLANRLTDFSPYRTEVFSILQTVAERLASFLAHLAACFSYWLSPFKGSITESLANRLTNLSLHRPEVLSIPEAIDERLATFFPHVLACFS
jgi:hypothetical protein